MRTPFVLGLGLSALLSVACAISGGPDDGEKSGNDPGSGSGGGGPSAGVGGVDGGDGGTTGGGGADGSGGTDGSGSASSGDGGSPGGVDCQSADILCETFDTALPTGAPWIEKTCTDGGYVRNIAAGEGASGTGALFTSGASTSANTSCPLHADLGTHDEFWVRARLKITGNNPADEHEVTFFELGEDVNADDPELRIGYRGDNSCNNNGTVYAGFELGATKSASGEFTGCTGVVPSAETWYCMEVHVEQSGDPMYSELYVDGTKLDTLVHSQPRERVEGNFKVQYLKVGMQSYGGTFDGLLIDEIAVSSTRLPCD